MPDARGSYATGSIHLLRLTNFLTYSYAEIKPGPSLNMVIGPNGTGKSTIVCAIALGLCGKPDLLGRARELQDFIKHGQDRAIIEIHLFHPEKQIVIQRMFEKGSNQSTWKLNGSKTKEAAIKEVVEGLCIQVDNLCQFLPQDRVSGFAQVKIIFFCLSIDVCF